MSRRFRYYTLPAGVASSREGPVVIRVEAGQDYELFESVQDGRWVQDNAAYEYVHGSPEVEQRDAAAVRELLADLVGPDTADRLVPRPTS